MGSVINQVNNIMFDFLGRICGFQSGGFELCRGHHEITVPIDIRVRSIWTEVVAHGTDGCGQFPVNKIGCLMCDYQVIFIADIETDTAVVKWFAVA